MLDKLILWLYGDLNRVLGSFDQALALDRRWLWLKNLIYLVLCKGTVSSTVVAATIIAGEIFLGVEEAFSFILAAI